MPALHGRRVARGDCDMRGGGSDYRLMVFVGQDFGRGSIDRFHLISYRSEAITPQHPGDLLFFGGLYYPIVLWGL